MSTPGNTRASSRTATVTSTAHARNASVSVSPAKPQSSERCPDSNQVSCASGSVTP